MAAASYHPRILIPEFGQKDNVKLLTANRGLPFVVRWPNLDLKASNIREAPQRDWTLNLLEESGWSTWSAKFDWHKPNRFISIPTDSAAQFFFKNKILNGRLRPEVQTLILSYTIFDRKKTPFKQILSVQAV